jgi:hypothetical protein
MTSGNSAKWKRVMALGMVWMAFATEASSQAGAQPSAADMETARTLYQQGRQLREQGNVAAAMDKFKAAHALAGTPVTGIHLAQSQADLGLLVEARETCLSILRMQVKPDETERSVEARRDAAKLAELLEPRIPSLVVRVDGVNQGVTPTVTIDGQAMPAAALGMVRKVNPGRHEVRVAASGYLEAMEQLSLAEGESRELALTLRPAPPGSEQPAAVVPPPGAMAPRPPPRNERKEGMSPFAVAGFVVAGSGAAVGTLSGLLAMQQASELEDKCTGNECPPDAHGDLDNGRMFGTVSTVAFGVAAVGLTVGIVALLAQDDEPEAPPPRVSPWVGLGSAGVGGVF